jgi:hypothetical protein
MTHLTLFRAMLLICFCHYNTFPWWMWIYALILEFLWFAEYRVKDVQNKLDSVLSSQSIDFNSNQNGV